MSRGVIMLVGFLIGASIGFSITLLVFFILRQFII